MCFFPREKPKWHGFSQKEKRVVTCFQTLSPNRSWERHGNSVYIPSTAFLSIRPSDPNPSLWDSLIHVRFAWKVFAWIALNSHRGLGNEIYQVILSANLFCPCSRSPTATEKAVVGADSGAGWLVVWRPVLSSPNTEPPGSTQK